MIKNTDKLADLLLKLNINVEQFYLMYLIYLKENKNIEKYEWKHRYIRELIERGFILDITPPSERAKQIIEEDTSDPKFKAKYLVVTAMFYEEILIDSDDAFEELFDIYWRWMLVDGRRIPARNGNPDELGILYGKGIKNDLVKHREILEKINNAKKNMDYPFVGLEKFIRDRRWNDFDDLTDNNNNFQQSRTV